MTNGYTVYIITSPEGKRYVGMTRVDPHKRWRRWSGYKSNRAFYADIEKYGWDAFEKTIVCTNLSEKEASKQEQLYIKRYDTQNPAKGYNTEKGGLHPEVLNKKTRKKMSAAHIGLPRNKTYRENISKSKMGKKNGMFGKKGKDNPTSRPVEALKEGAKIGRYESMKEANDMLNLQNGAFKNISACCRGKRKSAYGYAWRFTE